MNRRKNESKTAPRLTKSGIVRRPEESEAIRFVGARVFDPLAEGESAWQAPGCGPWVRLDRPDRPNAPGIGVVAFDEPPRYRATFSLMLNTVSSRGVDRSRPGRPYARDDAKENRNRHDALNALVGSLREGETLSVVYALEHAGFGAPGLRIWLQCSVEGNRVDGCIERARLLFDDVSVAMAAGSTEFGFQATELPLQSVIPDAAWRVRLVPVSLEVDAGEGRSLGFGAREPGARVRLPLPPLREEPHLALLAPALMACPRTAEVRIDLTRRVIADEQLQLIRGATRQLIDGDPAKAVLVGASGTAGVLGLSALNGVRAMMEAWFAEPEVATVEVTVASEAPVPDSLTALLGAEVLQGRPFTVQKISGDALPKPVVDLGRLIPRAVAFPPVFPAPMTLDALGFPRHFPAVRFPIPEQGLVLGDLPTQQAAIEVRFAAEDRAQHCYVVGSTGTGKSTLLREMIVQDLVAGEGLAVIDPHGDLFEQVLAAVPARRRADLVVIDFTDLERFIGLNFLECVSSRRDFEKNFITHELAEIFWRLYSHSPESMGPIFHQYMRNAVALLMEDPHGDATLLEIPAVFTDRLFRASLVNACRDVSVREFWEGIAEQVTGEASLANIAPYVLSKFGEFVQNELVRLVVGQSRSTVNFRKVMDERKILLVNLSKGLLSDADSRFLGMVLTSRLFGAALSRANAPRSRRTPFYLYMDEFQNFTTASVAQMLAESRKYGLVLTLAHQNLAQLPKEFAESVLANAGSRIIMRVGSPDARQLADFVAPHLTEEDLVTLPDHHAAVRMKVHGVPSPAFVMRTRADRRVPIDAMSDEARAGAVKAAKVRYTREAEEVRGEIVARRHRHLLGLTPQDLDLSETATAFLRNHGVNVLGDLVRVGSGILDAPDLPLRPRERRVVERVMVALGRRR